MKFRGKTNNSQEALYAIFLVCSADDKWDVKTSAGQLCSSISGVYAMRYKLVPVGCRSPLTRLRD